MIAEEQMMVMDNQKITSGRASSQLRDKATTAGDKFVVGLS
jgi:hypothetical protein